MHTPRSQMETRELPNCHGGVGKLWNTLMLSGGKGAGFRFVHDNIVEPGATIGEHTHKGDEEIYIILDGYGQMRIDGVDTPVGPGDMVITRDGHSHSLTNGPAPMRLLVVGVGL